MRIANGSTRGSWIGSEFLKHSPMANSNNARLRSRLAAPGTLLTAGLVLALGLALAPERWSAAMKGPVATLLRPGQLSMLTVREFGSRAVIRLKSHFQTAARLAELERERQRLICENRRLAAEVTAARTPRSDSAGDSEDGLEPLLTARCVNARVLGEQARAFLGRQHLLDAGTEAGVRPGALVVETPPGLIDQGRDVGLEAGQLVLSRRGVWGKVVAVGRWTSTVRTVTEPGYRDLVRLGDSGPEGILEGAGGDLARVRLVEVTEPVAVGDPVYSAAGKGFLSEPPLYGRVVRAERPVGAAYWEIWVQPAVNPNRQVEVTVLRITLNPLRVARLER